MATLRNKRKLGAVLRGTPENTRKSQSQNTFEPGMVEKYIAQVSEEIEGRVIETLFKEFTQTESQILGALSKLDEFLLRPHARTCFVTVPGTSRNNNSENLEPTGDHSLDDTCPEVVFTACLASNLKDPEQKETHHTDINTCKFEYKIVIT